MSRNLTDLLYLVTIVTFILALRFLSSPRRARLGNWLGALSYAGVRSYNNLMYFFGDLPPGTRFEDRFGNNVQVPGFARVFVTSTARRTWYDALLLSVDRPISVDGRWGFNLAYTYAEAE